MSIPTTLFVCFLAVGGDCYERLLVPLAIESRPGANGSNWRSTLTLFNRSNTALQFRNDLIGIYGYPTSPDTDRILPGEKYEALVLANTFFVDDLARAIPAAMIGVRCDRARDLEASISVSELRRDGFRTVHLPVVSEFRTFKTAFAIHDVPLTNPDSRTTVRIYDLDGHSVWVRVSLEIGGSILWTEMVSLKSAQVGVTEEQPSYAELVVPSAHEPVAGRLAVEVMDGGSHRLWGFVSATSPDSRDVRVSLPAGGSETWDEERCPP